MRSFAFPFGSRAPDLTPAVLEALHSANVDQLIMVERGRNRRSNGPCIFRHKVDGLDPGVLTSEIEAMPLVQATYRTLLRRAAN